MRIKDDDSINGDILSLILIHHIKMLVAIRISEINIRIWGINSILNGMEM